MATAVNRLLMQRPKAIFLNAARLDYDKALCFRRLQNLTDLTLHDVDCIKSSDDIVELVNSSKAEIVITKEMLVRYIMTSCCCCCCALHIVIIDTHITSHIFS